MQSKQNLKYFYDTDFVAPATVFWKFNFKVLFVRHTIKYEEY